MSPQRYSAVLVLPALAVAVAVALVRLLRGPSLADRVVAFDLLAAISIGILAAYAVAEDEPVFIDVTAVLALVSFLGTVGFALHLREKS